MLVKFDRPGPGGEERKRRKEGLEIIIKQGEGKGEKEEGKDSHQKEKDRQRIKKYKRGMGEESRLPQGAKLGRFSELEEDEEMERNNKPRGKRPESDSDQCGPEEEGRGSGTSRVRPKWDGDR